MSELGDRLQERARRLWRWFFPPRIELPEEVARLLRAVYPALDLGAVSFYQGIPHLIGRLGGQAITIPALFARRRTCIYVEPRSWDLESAEGIGTLVHEAYHALQAQECGWGLGPLRPFLLLYFAHGAANRFRYHGHPMEEDAFQLAGRHWSRFEAACACARMEPGGTVPVEAAAIERAGLATSSSGLRFWRGLARSLPFAPPPLLVLPLLPVWLLVWTGAASLAWLARLLVEGAGAATAALLWGAGAIASGLSRIFFRRI
ncbi:MAG: hypothetical protein ABIS20_22400 [Thermoanaerobaculia bacterium]